MTKESKQSPYNKLIFRQTFNSEQDIRNNGGKISGSGETLKNGIFKTNDSATILYNKKLNGTYTLRFRMKIFAYATNEYFWMSNNSKYFRYGSTGILASTSGTKYINGVPNLQTTLNEDLEIVLTGISLTDVEEFYLGRYYASPSITDTQFDLFEIYQGTMTASEVYNLHYDNWNKELNGMGGQISRENLIPEASSAFETDGTSFYSPVYRGVLNWNSTTKDATMLCNTTVSTTMGITKPLFTDASKSYRIRFKAKSENNSCTSTISGHVGTGTATWKERIVIKQPDLTIEYQDFEFISSGASTLYIALQTQPLISGTTQFTIDDIYVQEINPKTLLDFDSTNGVISEKIAGSTDAEDIPRTFLASLGTPTINGDIITFSVGTNEAARQTFYWEPGSTYLVRVNVTNYSGTGNIILPYGAAAAEFAKKDGFYEYKITSDNTTMQIYSPTTNGAIIEVLSIQEIIPELTNTSVTIKKTGSKTAADFNGTTSKIDVGYDPIGTKAVTAMAWVNSRSLGEGGTGEILGNSKFRIRNRSNSTYQVYSDGITYMTGGVVKLGKRQFIAVTRKIDGSTSMYIGESDNSPILYGVADQSSGTPADGTNLIIGNSAAQIATFDGTIPKLKIVEGILDLKQITQYWSETRGDIQ